MTLTCSLDTEPWEISVSVGLAPAVKVLSWGAAVEVGLVSLPAVEDPGLARTCGARTHDPPGSLETAQNGRADARLVIVSRGAVVELQRDAVHGFEDGVFEADAE